MSLTLEWITSSGPNLLNSFVVIFTQIVANLKEFCWNYAKVGSYQAKMSLNYAEKSLTL
jgi:hypothetical protein